MGAKSELPTPLISVLMTTCLPTLSELSFAAVPVCTPVCDQSATIDSQLVPDSAIGSIMPHDTNKSRNRPRTHHHMSYTSLMHAPTQLARA